MYLFHGSPARNIEKFKLESSRYQSLEGTGVYFTMNYRLARKYAGSEGSIYKCELKVNSFFDATTADDFTDLFEKISKLIGMDILKIEGCSKLINGLTKGQYEINDEQELGLFFHVKRMLSNSEKFNSKFEDNLDETLTEIKEFISNHMSQYPVMKYNSGEPHLGAFFIVRDCSLIAIRSEIEVGSDLDIEYLEASD